MNQYKKYPHENFLFFLFLLPLYQATAENSYGITLFDEYYPSVKYAPHAHGISFSYSHDADKTREKNNPKKLQLSYDATVSLEEDPELYDSDRDPVSLHLNINAKRPLKRKPYNMQTSIVTGINIEENGPQINDRHYMAHTGIQLEKTKLTRIGKFSTKASAEIAYYFFEVDDESAFNETGARKGLLDHYGLGTLFKFNIRFDKGNNRVNVFFSEIRATDKSQNMDDYEREITGIELSRKISKKTRCGFKFSVIEHKYKPVVLIHADELYQSNISCFYRF